MGEPRIAGNQNGAWSDVYAAALCVAQLFGTKTQSQHSAHGLLYDFGEGCFAGAEGKITKFQVFHGRVGIFVFDACIQRLCEGFVSPAVPCRTA